MWTAEIINKSLEKGTLLVHVSFTDGTETFGESFPISTVEDLERRITARLKQLESVETVKDSIVEGPFTPKPDSVPTPYEIALRGFSRVKNLLNLCILKETDQEYIDAVDVLKSEYAKL